MNERTGQVKAINFRDFQSIKLWTFQLEGSDRYYRTGKNQPDIEEGQWISFTERNGIVQMETLMEVATGNENVGADQTSAPSAPTRPGQVVVTPVAPAGAVVHRETVPATNASDVGRRMQYQAARRDASNIIIAALHTDHLPHATNVAKGKRLDLLLQYVEEVTQALLSQEDPA
jgi:hypothetical protein